MGGCIYSTANPSMKITACINTKYIYQHHNEISLKLIKIWAWFVVYQILSIQLALTPPKNKLTHSLIQKTSYGERCI